MPSNRLLGKNTDLPLVLISLVAFLFIYGFLSSDSVGRFISLQDGQTVDASLADLDEYYSDKPQSYHVLSAKGSGQSITEIRSKSPPHQILTGDEDRVLIQYDQRILHKLDNSLRDITEIIEDGRYLEDGTIPVIIEIRDDIPLPSAILSMESLFGKTPGSRLVGRLNMIHSLYGRIDMGYLDVLADDPTVEKIWLDRIVEVDLNESIPIIRADHVWNKTDILGNEIRGSGVKIAILDTGIDYTHPDLGSCTSTQFSSCICSKVTRGYDFANGDGDPMDDQGHGTHVAATAGGTGQGGGGLVGVAPGAELWGVKVLFAGGYGYWSDIISGIDWSSDPNGDGLYNDAADVISMSLGGGCDPCDGKDPVSQAIDNATARGSLVVVAAGNSYNEYTVGVPGVAENALTVAASDKLDSIAEFSSKGPSTDLRIKPDITAPGVSICAAQWSSWLDDYRCGPSDRHITISGTSMATPHVSGAAALLKQIHPDWSPQEIKSALTMSAVDIGFLPTHQGSGRLDVMAASETPLVADRDSIDFGDIGTSETSTIGITLTNKGTDPITVTATAGDAIRSENGMAYPIITLSPNAFTIPVGSSVTLSATANLSGKSGYYQGVVSLNDGSNDYRIPYSAARYVAINVEVLDEAGGRVAGSANVFHSDFKTWESSFNRYSHSFRVPAGNDYHVFAMGTNFILRDTIIAPAPGEVIDVVFRLENADIYKFEAFDSKGRYLNEYYKDNFLYIEKSGTPLVMFGTYSPFSLKVANHSLRLSGLDLSELGYDSYLVRTSVGSYIPECVGGLSKECLGAKSSPSEWNYAGWMIKNANPQEGTHYTWRPQENASEPRRITADMRHAKDDDVLIFQNFGRYLGHIVGTDYSIGMDAVAYYPNNTDWVFEMLAVNYQNQRYGYEDFTQGENPISADHRIDPSSIGDARLLHSPLEIGRLYTNGSSLESTDYFLKNGQIYLYDKWGYMNSYITPRVSVYRDGVLVADRNVEWTRNIFDRSMRYDISDGSHRVVLEIPDIAIGKVTQTYHFNEPSQDRTSPYIGSFDFEQHFTKNEPYTVSITALDDFDTVSSVKFEYSQGGSWSLAPTEFSDGAYSATLIPTESGTLRMRMTLNDSYGNSVEYLFDSFAVESIKLSASAVYNEKSGRVSGSCKKPDGSWCPDLNIKVLCDGQVSRSWYARDGVIGSLDISFCPSRAIDFRFDGSGAYLPFFVNATPDTVPPSAYVSIDNGSPSTGSRLVNLRLECSDDRSVAYAVRYANEDRGWGLWEPFSSVKEWVLSEGNGTKTVYYQCQDLVGNTIETSDSIELHYTATSAPATNAVATKPDGTLYDFAWTNAEYVDVELVAVPVPSTEIKETRYCIDTSNSCSPDKTYASPIRFGKEGVHYLRYYSINTAGEVEEPINSRSVSIDRIAPSLEFITPKSGHLYFYGADKGLDPLGQTRIAGDISIEIRIVDQNLKTKDFFVDEYNRKLGTSWRPSIYIYRWDATYQLRYDGLGQHLLKVVAQDHAGNIAQITLPVVIIAP